jgi:hypothetical protein
VSQQDDLDGLHEQAAALEARAADERVKLARRGAHRQAIVEEANRAREQRDARAAAYAQHRGDPSATRETKEASAQEVAVHTVMASGAEEDVTTAAADELAQEQECGRVDAALADVRRKIRTIELLRAVDPLVVAEEVERIWALVLEAPAHALPSGLNTFETYAAGIGAKEDELRALGVPVVSLDRAKFLLPLWCAEAAKGHAPPIGTDLYFLRNSIERTARTPLGLPAMTSSVDVAALFKHLALFAHRRPVHVAKFRERVAALRPLRTLRELEALELREAAEADALRAESYVPPVPPSRLPREPGQRPGGATSFHSLSSPMHALEQRAAQLATRVAESAARFAAKVKP